MTAKSSRPSMADFDLIQAVFHDGKEQPAIHGGLFN